MPRVVVTSPARRSSNTFGIATVVESDGIFTNWMRENQVSAVIVRPDRYAFAGAANADELNTSMENLIKGLCGRS